MYFSKSKYTEFLGCERHCWLKKHKPEVAQPSAMLINLFNRGHAVGEVAKGLFGPYEDVTAEGEDGKLDLPVMLDRTAELIVQGADVICEAAFSYNGLYCAVDILKRVNDGYAIYEVKSSSHIRDYHYDDAAYQTYVLCKCGVNVKGAHIVTLNSDYVRRGELELRKLFIIDGGADISGIISARASAVENNLARAERLLEQADEPAATLCRDCSGCDCMGYCFSDVPKPSVLDLYNMRGKWDLFDKGVRSLDDVLMSNVRLTAIQRMQIDHALNECGTYVNKEGISAFLNTLWYPLYFLDFETMSPPIPMFDGDTPTTQIPFQYSLHYMTEEGGKVEHKEFLAETGTDPRRALAERLCDDIPENACVLAYHASTEGGIIRELARRFPDLSDRLIGITSGIRDLLPVFQKGNYYNRAMGGSFSIKSVLPAVFPEDAAADYHNLDGVSNGIEAMDVFPRLKDMPPDEQLATREALLRYCELDTFAMVRLLKELYRVVN